MTALPSLERLKELRATAAGHDWAYRDARCPMGKDELLALLDAAIAMRRAEEWMSARPGLRCIAEACIDHGGWHVTLHEWHEGNLSRFSISDGGPDFLSALAAALDKAEVNR